MASSNDRHPWELSSLQRGLVDNCFEEGQYETAIATLDQLRSPHFNPWPPHIRQLIYISLQSTQESPTEFEADTPIQASPSKIVKQHQHQMSSNLVPAKAVVDAQKLLMAYLRTNSPVALSRALPRRRSPPTPFSGHNEGDSTVAKRAALITQCKDCWQLLHSDFMSHQSISPSTPKAKARRQTGQTGYDILGAAKSNVAPPMVITDDAWPLLHWLVSLYEHDEELSEEDGNARHSPSLAEQILDDNGNTCLDVPIAIVAHCLVQKQLQRHHLAGRLLSLLINLTTTMEFDLQALVAAAYTRIQSFEQLSLLMAQLSQPTAIPVLKFKIALCQKLIGCSGLPAMGNVSKPQPRIRARPAKAADKQTSIIVDLPLVATKSSIPAFSEIMRLFQGAGLKKSLDDFSTAPAWYQYQLLSAYGSLQACLAPADRDSDWLKALTQDFPSIVHDVYSQKGNEASIYQRLLEIQIANWRILVDATH